MIEKKQKKKQDKFTTLVEMGKFYFINQKYDEAIREFTAALELKKDSADLYLNIGLTYEAKSDLVNAKQMYEKALSIDPGNVKANEHIEKIIDR